MRTERLKKLERLVRTRARLTSAAMLAELGDEIRRLLEELGTLNAAEAARIHEARSGPRWTRIGCPHDADVWVWVVHHGLVKRTYSIADRGKRWFAGWLDSRNDRPLQAVSIGLFPDAAKAMGACARAEEARH